jgi:Uma2 family endonuclease
MPTTRMAELVDGHLEILPTPTWLHQLIVRFFANQLLEHVRNNNLQGEVLFSPLPVRLFPGTIREPDVLFVTPDNYPAEIDGYPGRPDLVMEVVSNDPQSRYRDYEAKRQDYAKAGIPEYWIIDFEQSTVLVLTLIDGSYQEHAKSTDTTPATSQLFPGFRVAFSDIQLLAQS